MEDKNNVETNTTVVTKQETNNSKIKQTSTAKSQTKGTRSSTQVTMSELKVTRSKSKVPISEAKVTRSLTKATISQANGTKLSVNSSLQSLNIGNNSSSHQSSNNDNDQAYDDVKMMNMEHCQDENSSEVPAYSSLDTVKSADNTPIQNKKQRKSIPWVQEKRFGSVTEVNEFLNDEGTWSYSFTNQTTFGEKRFFRCNKVKRRSKTQCEAKIHLLYESTSDEVIRFRSESEHTHDECEDRNTAISTEVKQEIEKYFDLHLKPKAILTNIRRSNLPIPGRFQLSNYLARLQKEKYGAASICLGKLQKWIHDNSTIPDDEHTPFVVSSDVWGTDGLENSERGFRVLITTKHLLQFLSHRRPLHIDTTYKLIWQGYPVTPFGVTDIGRHFNPVGLAITLKEEIQDFEFIFKSIKENMRKLFNFDYKPEVLVSDAAPAIHNAARRVFGDLILIIMCWFHVKKAVRARLNENSNINRNDKEQILVDLDTLQLAWSKEIFEKALEALYRKWDKYETFVEYFKNEWVFKNPNWYEGVRHATPKTDNALEGFNGSIKGSYTFRERKPVGQFLNMVLRYVEDWSRDYQQSIKTFQHEISISLQVWTSSYQWAKLDKTLKKSTANGICTYLVPAGNRKVVESNEFNTFNEFKASGFAYYTTSIPVDNDWRCGTCTCPAFFKFFLCKHVIGILVRTRALTAPVEAKNIPLGVKRKRGRPSKSKKALVVQ